MTGMAIAAMAATIRAVKLYFAGWFLMREILASTTCFGNRSRVRVSPTKVRVSYPPGKATGILVLRIMNVVALDCDGLVGA
jgi:hypothetical protein